MNLLTEGRKALIARLQTITVANGYRTDAGLNVRAGWFNEVLQSDSVGFPLIVLQKAKGERTEAGSGAIKVYPGFNVVGAVDVGLTDYDDALEDLELDLMQCLAVAPGRRIEWAARGISGITIGASEHYPPGSGERAASVLVPVNLFTVINMLGRCP